MLGSVLNQVETEVGRKILAEHPGTTGSLGCAISEAVEKAVTSDGYRYVLGSVLNQVLLHQSVIGLETKAALDKFNIKPDIEAVEKAVTSDGYRYVLGSVLNQVLLHQSVIGLETKAALDKFNIKPDIIIGCAGGGSNLGGLIAPFMGEKLRGEADYRIIAVEPADLILVV